MNRMFRQRKYDTRRIDRQYAEETDVYVMLYNSYADALYAYGMGFGFDNETVKDVIHDIFLDIMTRQVDLGRIVNIKAYLFRIVHNAWSTCTVRGWTNATFRTGSRDCGCR